VPPRPSPTADLARMYRERIPTAPKSIGRQAPAIFSSGRNFGFLAPVGRLVKTAVESLDPRFIASEGGRSVQHVVGDATELGRSIITGEDTLSESPTARAYQAAGGGAPGVLAAALPYVNVGTAVLPTTRVLTPTGRLAMSADVAERAGNKLLAEGIAKEVADATESAIGVPTYNAAMSVYGNERANYLELANKLAERGMSFQNFPPETGAVWAWTQPNEYRDLQTALRGGLLNKNFPTSRQQMTTAIDRVIASNPRLANEIRVFRGVSPKTNNWDAIVQAVENAQPGQVFLTDKGFTATSFDPSVMKRFATGSHGLGQPATDGGYSFIISVPRGTRGIDVDSFLKGVDPSGQPFTNAVGEKEFLLPRNSGLRFVRREGNRIFVELVPGPVHSRPYPQTPYRNADPLDYQQIAEDFARSLATMHDEPQVS